MTYFILHFQKTLKNHFSQKGGEGAVFDTPFPRVPLVKLVFNAIELENRKSIFYPPLPYGEGKLFAHLCKIHGIMASFGLLLKLTVIWHS
jgi:hypothetical protein